MDLDSLRAEADDLLAQFEKMQRNTSDMQNQMKAVQITQKSSDGLVSATVGPQGQLIKLDLDPRVFRAPDAGKLSESITSTIKKAAEKASERMLEICRPYISEDQLRPHLDGDFKGVMDGILDKIGPKGI